MTPTAAVAASRNFVEELRGLTCSIADHHEVSPAVILVVLWFRQQQLQRPGAFQERFVALEAAVAAFRGVEGTLVMCIHD